MNSSSTAAAPDAFVFGATQFDPPSGTLTLAWRVPAAGGRELREQFVFSPPLETGRVDTPAFAAAVRLLHWLCGVSYWKLACAGPVRFAGDAPDLWQARALEEIYCHGLAELAWRNQLRGRYWPDFQASAGSDHLSARPAGLASRALVPIGGGKDSLVALERVRAAGVAFETVQVGSAPLIERSVDGASPRHHIIQRRLAPELVELNRAGALNGHVPITAINAAALIVAALLWDFDAVVFANERSASSPTLVAPDGREVNHQFAKSLAFETLFGEWLRRYIAPDLDVFSMLRRESELSICREFAGLTRYHERFSSCNRNFHLDGPRTRRWCLNCPKCRFVFLALAPFLDPARMQAIFGSDLLSGEARLAGFVELLELDGHRPFECVGEADEARAAVGLLERHPGWRDHAGVRALAERISSAGVVLPPAAPLLKPQGPHRIPARFRTSSNHASD